MAKLGVSLSIRTEWIPFDTDLSTCGCCEETIYSKMMVLCITPFSDNKQWPTKPTELKVCRSCFDLLVED